jgi:uncharacterized damage-inducible protein DinB
MQQHELLVELYDRIPPLVAEVADGLSAEELQWRPSSGANSIGWLLWHLIRVQDHHLTELIGGEQVWVTSDWASRFGLEPNPNNTGYGHSPAEVGAVRPDGPEAVTGYCEAVTARSREFLASLEPSDLDRVVDRRWDPPVTMGVRLVSVADDDLQHAGQAAYARGLLDRSS